MGEENSFAFKCVKIALIVLYVLSIIFVIFFIAIAIFGLAILGSNNDPKHKITPEEKENARVLFTGAIILFAISLICAIIALIGVIKENKCIIITMTVFSVIGVIVHIVQGDIGSAIVSLLCAILTGVFAYMIIQKEKKNTLYVQNTKGNTAV